MRKLITCIRFRVHLKMYLLCQFWSRFLLTFILYSIGVCIFSFYADLVLLRNEICFKFSSHTNLLEEYDYIIVGAGSAGSTIAGGLTSSLQNSVLVIEAGSQNQWLLDIPIIGPLIQGSRFDWKYTTVAQKNACLGLKNTASKWPMGKVVGGSSILNNMVHVRGHPYDYKDWFDTNKESYNYEKQVLPTFKKIEQYLPTNYLKYSTILGDTILNSGKEQNLHTKDDSGFGFFTPLLNQQNGRRFTTSHAHSLTSNKNIDLLTDSNVVKVLFKNNVAYGVKYTQFGHTQIALARKGVILSAGVIGSPKLLMLSGIGPKEHLNDIGINVVKDLPVGLNLQDHITTGLDLITLNISLGLNVGDLVSPFTFFDYFFKDKGPMTTPGIEAVAFLKTDYVTNKNNTAACESLDIEKFQPDLQLMVLPLGITKDAGVHLKNSIGVSEEVWSDYFKPLFLETSISILPILLHPKSRGHVQLKDSNPESAPIINPLYLSHEDDLEILIKGIETIKKLINMPFMQKLGAKFYDKKFPGCETYDFDTRDYWVCYIRHFTLTSYHPAGTCKMGPLHNSDTVVNNKDFKVKGFSNLYIADASVFPNLPSGNINAAVVMVAEKLVEYLLKDNKMCVKPEQSVCIKGRFYADWIS